MAQNNITLWQVFRYTDNGHTVAVTQLGPQVLADALHERLEAAGAEEDGVPISYTVKPGDGEREWLSE